MPLEPTNTSSLLVEVVLYAVSTLDADAVYEVDFNAATVTAEINSYEALSEYKDSFGYTYVDRETFDGQNYVNNCERSDADGNVISEESGGFAGDPIQFNLGTIQGNTFGGESLSVLAETETTEGAEIIVDVNGGFFGNHGNYIAGTIVGEIGIQGTDDGSGDYIYEYSETGTIIGVFEGEAR